jgi:hypothetical protein
MEVKTLDDFDPEVVNRPLTEEDKAIFSAAIAAYKAARHKKENAKKRKNSHAIAA